MEESKVIQENKEKLTIVYVFLKKKNSSGITYPLSSETSITTTQDGTHIRNNNNNTNPTHTVSSKTNNNFSFAIS